MRILYDYAVIFYSKYNFNNIDMNKLEPLISSDSIDSNIREVLKLNLNILEHSKYIEIDMKGEVELYFKNLGLYRFKTFIEGRGGIDGILNKLNEVEYNTSDIKDYLYYKLVDECFQGYQNKVVESMIEEGLEELNFKVQNNLVELGIKMKFNRILDVYTGGIHKGVQYFGGFSGTGKTTWAIVFYILPLLLEKDEKILIIANEQDKQVFQILLLVAYYTHIQKRRNVDKYRGKFISRNRLSRNIQNDNDKFILNDCIKSYKRYFSKKIKFVFTPKFVPDEVERLITINSRLGFKNVFIDTMKAERKGEYHLLSDLSQRLDKVAKENDLRIIGTVQLALHSKSRKYLDHTCLAESKQIVEIAENSLYFREVDNIDELSTLDIYHYDDFTKTWDTQKVVDVVNKEEKFKYILIFIGKNRHGDSNKVILSKVNFDNMYYKEIGVILNLAYDGY